jgi:hypothetical protein
LIYGIKRAPERTGPVVRIGDTINNESLQPSVDLDDFQLEAPAGARFDVCILIGPPSGNASGQRVGVFVPLPPLGGLTSNYASSVAGASAPTCVGPFATPATGPTVLKVDGSGRLEIPYQLQIRPAP